MKATSLAINVYRLSASRVREESKEFATFSPVSTERTGEIIRDDQRGRAETAVEFE